MSATGSKDRSWRHKKTYESVESNLVLMEAQGTLLDPFSRKIILLKRRVLSICKALSLRSLGIRTSSQTPKQAFPFLGSTDAMNYSPWPPLILHACSSCELYLFLWLPLPLVLLVPLTLSYGVWFWLYLDISIFCARILFHPSLDIPYPFSSGCLFSSVQHLLHMFGRVL